MSEPILGKVPGYEWSSELAASYDVAVDILGLVILCCTVLIEQEERKDAPRADEIAAWDRQIGSAAALRHSLDDQDAEQIRRVTEEYGALVRSLDKKIEDR